MATPTNIELIDYKFKTMEDRFDRLETLIKEGFAMADSKFATKEEHQINKEKIERIESIQSKVWMTLIGTLWTIFLWFCTFILKKLWII